MNIGLSLASTAATALLGRQIMTQAISDASYSIYSSIGEIFYYTSYVDRSLCQLDIGNKIKTMELMCKDISELDKLDSASVNYCLENLHDMIVRIREDLKQINSIIKLHKEKYFNNWRSVDVKEQLNNLRIHTQLLDQRYDLLVKTLNITNNIKN